MNTLLSLLLLQGCVSLRFNELLGSESDTQVDADDEGRRRRRRRRRRGYMPTSPSSTRELAGHSFNFVEDYDRFDSIMDAAFSETDGNTAKSVESILEGWIMLQLGTKDNDRYLSLGNVLFHFDKNRHHSFETRFAVEFAAVFQMFIGLASAKNADLDTICINCIGFGNKAAGGTVLDFNSKGASTAIAVKPIKKKTAGDNIVIVKTAGFGTATALKFVEPTNAIKVGWSYLPGGQYGVAVTAGQTGMYALYYNGVFQEQTACKDGAVSILGMGVSIDVQSASGHTKTLFVDYVTFKGTNV